MMNLVVILVEYEQQLNITWLLSRKHAGTELDEGKEKNVTKLVRNDFIRYRSKKNEGTTITFSRDEIMPEIFKPSAPPRPPQNVS